MPSRNALLSLALVAACSSPPAAEPLEDAAVPEDAGPGEPVARFDLDGVRDDFFAFPFPSDLRTHADGRPDLTGYPNPGIDLVTDMLRIADQRPRFPTLPVAYFRFDTALATRDASDVVAAEAASPILIVDVDATSPERGRLVPAVAIDLVNDVYSGPNLLGVGPVPGFVLAPDRTYAVVVRRGLGDARGRMLDVPAALATLARGETPSASWGERARAVYAPLWETHAMIGVAADDVAAATVFTTGDVVAETRALAEAVLAAHSITIESLRVDPADGDDHPRYCELRARASMPQFQEGTPPFDEAGTFILDGAGAPTEQRREDVPIVITIPRGEMPAGGFPLMVYFHGSGGIAAQVVDRGPRPAGGVEAVGEGPAHMIAARGFAAVGAALPLSPDRLPGAGATEYLNLRNLAAFRDTFRQGVIEQRLLIRAMTELRIDPATLGSCTGVTLPAGETAIRFDANAFVGLGQSMGGMYTNMIGAVEPSLRALVPTGAGGYWGYFILETSLIPGARALLAASLRTSADRLSQLHPGLSLLEMAWEGAEPLVYMPRISRRPLPGIGARPIYEPVGEHDSYFPPAVYDAVALAYGHPQAGERVWPEMQARLALAGLDGVLDYPVRGNLVSAGGEPYTGAVVQYAGDGFSDPHNIFTQLPAVRYQWTCFLESALRPAGAAIFAPADEASPCPE